MRQLFNLCIVLILLVTEELLAQQISIKPEQPVICYKSNNNNPGHIPPPEKFKQWRQGRAAGAKTAAFEVEYVNFPSDNQAKAAFQFAVDIWETQLISSVTIKVQAQWGTLESGVLGQAIWGSAHANFDGAQHLNTFYPVALAEKMAGHELNAPGDADIVATFNSATNWYFGTDGVVPSGKMDLVTIVLHEIGHGLGFTDTYSFSSNQGSVGLQQGGTSIPFVYDLFVENASGQKLFSQFASPSTGLGNQLTSNAIFYNSPLAVISGQKPKLFAPSPYDDGSSIAHLDEATYVTPGNANNIMTPQIASQESIHDPGSIMLNMFRDMGWVFTRIQHEPLKDTERVDGAPYNVLVNITSDNGYDQNTVKLHYTIDGTTFTEVVMTPTGTPNEFVAELPGTSATITYGYFISVNDVLNRSFTKPGKIQTQNQAQEQSLITFSTGPDTDKPEIVHVPVEYIFQEETQLLITADVTDNIGVEIVSLRYTVKEGPEQGLRMMPTSPDEDEYQATIDLPPGLNIGDLIKYRIIARDTSANSNEGTAPVTGINTVFVTGIMPTQDSYVNDFNQPTTNFIGNSFSITTPANFDNGAIHSAHPYENGSGPNDESDYIYQLQVPIRTDDKNPFIQFDEVVLVEPGEDGSVFGDDDFYDYVAVEGSADGGVTWKNFADGYDSRSVAEWLTNYNSNISNNNSQATGNKGLFRERTINMLEKGHFVNGDVVLVRFRLFADQAANGWGWAIDNLSIQGPVTDLEEETQRSLKVYPNPAAKSMVLELTNTSNKDVGLKIINISGQTIFSDNVKGQHSGVTVEIDVTTYEDGLYLVRATFADKVISKKFIKVSR